MFVPGDLREFVICEYHDNRGHFGVGRTVAMIQEQFYFPRFYFRRSHVEKYIKRCELCARYKSDTRKL